MAQIRQLKCAGDKELLPRRENHDGVPEIDVVDGASLPGGLLLISRANRLGAPPRIGNQLKSNFASISSRTRSRGESFCSILGNPEIEHENDCHCSDYAFLTTNPGERMVDSVKAIPVSGTYKAAASSKEAKEWTAGMYEEIASLSRRDVFGFQLLSGVPM